MTFCSNDVKIFISNVREVLETVEIFITSAYKFEEEWELKQSTDVKYSPKVIVNDARETLIANEEKLLRKNMHCLVFGKTSSGKSCLINSLLGEEVLPVGSASTTNSFAEIQKSENDTNYIVFPDFPSKKEDISYINRIDEKVTNHVKEASRVNVYLSKLSYPLLEKDIVIVDTPGIDSGRKMDELIQKECDKANILILVISCAPGFGETENNFLTKYQTIFSNFKIIIIFNMADKIWKDFQHYKAKYTRSINAYLCKLLKVKRKDNDDSGIFFISAKERLQIVKNQSVSKNGWEQRNINYDKFKEYLKPNENSMNMHVDIKIQNDEIISTMFNVLEVYKNNIRNSITKKIIYPFEELIDLNMIINEEISLIFEEMYEMYFVKGRKLVKMFNDKDQSVIDRHWADFVDELMVILTESFKIRIKDKIHVNNPKDEEFTLKMLNFFYYPYYFSNLYTIDNSEICQLCSNYKKIISKITKYKRITIAGLAVGVGAITAAGGAVGGVVVALETVIAAPIFAVAGGTAGTVAGGLSSFVSTKITKFKRFAYAPRYKKQEEIIKEWWKKKKNLLLDSYKVFLDEFPEKALGFEEDYNDFENSIKKYKMTWGNILSEQAKIPRNNKSFTI